MRLKSPRPSKTEDPTDLVQVVASIRSAMPGREKRLTFSGSALEAFLKSKALAQTLLANSLIECVDQNQEGASEMKERAFYGFPDELERAREHYFVMVDVREGGLRIRNNLSRAKVRFSLCFAGSEAVDWLLDNDAGNAVFKSNRKEAKKMLQSFMDMGLIAHMVGKEKFEDAQGAFFRCIRAPRLCEPLFREGHVSVTFSDARMQYFSMWAQLDAAGMRFFRAREHAVSTYPLLFVPASSIVADLAEESNSLPGAPASLSSLKLSRKTSANSGSDSITKSFLDAGGSGSDSMGYQGVVWEFKPAMALWERMLAKQAEKNSAFIDGQGAVTGHEFVVFVNGPVRGGFGEEESEQGIKQIFFACGTARDQIEWMIALDELVLMAKPLHEAQLLSYSDAITLPIASNKSLRDYGTLGLPCRSRLVGSALKNDYLRQLVPEDGYQYRGWRFKCNLLIKADGSSVFSWNGFVALPISGLAKCYFHFDGSELSKYAARQDMASGPTLAQVKCSWQQVVPSLIDLILL